MKPELITIGVYGYDEETFFKALLDAGVDTFCDIRLRRGMRGSKYAFVNSTYLQQKLQELGISYVHHKELAPSREIRRQQEIIDKQERVKKRERETLSPAFIQAYQEHYLADFDPITFINSFGPNAQKIVLFCVERQPEACHRSLVADKLAGDLELSLTHLQP
jgi:uncharacterized protein (DUF488 family)